MPHKNGNRCARPTAAALLILLAAVGLAACGGSSKGSSTATSASATTTRGERDGQFAARSAALRTCLQKEGITLPKRPAGQGVPGASGQGGTPGQGSAPRGPFGLGAGAARRLPKGVTREKFEAALKKCGGGSFGRGGRGFNTAQGRQRFAKFAQCMRSNGIKLPAPNTSGTGPIFNTKGIDTNSAAFKAADVKCAKELGARRGRNAVPNGAPPASEGGQEAGTPGAAPPEGAAPESPPAG